MFGIGMQELAIIFVVALLIFGPKRLPELARTLGKGLAEFRRASTDLRQSFDLEARTPPPSSPPPPASPPPPPESIRPKAETGDPREQREAPARPAQAVDAVAGEGAADDDPERASDAGADADHTDLGAEDEPPAPEKGPEGSSG